VWTRVGAKIQRIQNRKAGRQAGRQRQKPKAGELTSKVEDNERMNGMYAADNETDCRGGKTTTRACYLVDCVQRGGVEVRHHAATGPGGL